MVDTMIDSADFDRADIIALLKDALAAKESAADFTKSFEKQTPPIRAYLEAHPDEDLYDGEHRIRAWLQSGGSKTKYDAPASIRKANPKLYKRLWLLGCFEVDSAAVTLAIKSGYLSAGDIAPYKATGERTKSFHIDRVTE